MSYYSHSNLLILTTLSLSASWRSFRFPFQYGRQWTVLFGCSDKKRMGALGPERTYGKLTPAASTYISILLFYNLHLSMVFITVYCWCKSRYFYLLFSNGSEHLWHNKHYKWLITTYEVLRRQSRLKRLVLICILFSFSCSDRKRQLREDV